MRLHGKTGRVIAGTTEISFQRSRNGRSLGHAPFDRVRDYAAIAPAAWSRANAVFLHLLPDESLWIGLSNDAPVSVELDGIRLQPHPPHRWIEGTPEHPLRPGGEITITLSQKEKLTVYLIDPGLYEKITGLQRRQPTPDDDTYGGYLLP